MTRIPYADSNGRLSVEVQLENAADVYLLDRTNFQKYQNGQDYKYYGGHCRQTPVNITVSGIGRWYLIVEGSRHYKYRFY
ncbi:DUF1883 domain-containing protein [Priestia megaterium]|uniref:DUF1883 domain-containing protein n=1 Tax=Priestia megaterium TaxID=1404 RepID=UPI0025B172B4|nr:DUF1883 domain-containing protein [Priestia megaterium]MDN3365381.1 DUF1883 domain-containing protein [Priestia megaterium]